MSKMMQDAGRVLDALHEGIVSGVIICLERQNPGISKKELGDKVKYILHDWNGESLEYWLEWFQIGQYAKADGSICKKCGATGHMERTACICPNGCGIIWGC